MILDFHSHILPGMDHGCADVSMALEQLRLAEAAGVEAIAATSHFYPHREAVDHFLNRRKSSWELLEKELPETAPKVVLGAEVLLCEGMERMEGLERLCLPSGALLLEMPFGGWNSRLIESVYAIYARYRDRLVLAHVERYPPQDMGPLLKAGMQGQVNGHGMCRLMARKGLRSWAKAGFLVAVGSDIHGVGKQYDYLAKAVKLLGDDYQRMEDVSRKLMGV